MIKSFLSLCNRSPVVVISQVRAGVDGGVEADAASDADRTEGMCADGCGPREILLLLTTKYIYILTWGSELDVFSYERYAWYCDLKVWNVVS